MTQYSAKKSTPSPITTREGREQLVRAARKYVFEEGTVAEFAKMHGLPRSTVFGWCKDTDGPRGRPRTLMPFNESKILKLFIESPGLQTSGTIQESVRKQSGEVLKRRTLLRLTNRWGLSAEQKRASGPMAINVSKWIQPAETVGKGSSPLRGTIWRLLSGRGIEGFMLTADDSGEVVENVAAAVVDRVKKKRKQDLMTNHRGLAVALRGKLKGWNVHQD